MIIKNFRKYWWTVCVVILIIGVKSALSGTISGTVYEETNGFPLSNVWVSLYSGDCNNRTKLNSLSTCDSSIPGQQTGTYRFENIPAGSYRLRVEPMESLVSSQYAPEWGNKSTYDAYTCDQADVITLTDSSTESLNFYVDAGATISGRVFHGDGATPVTWDESYVEIYAVDINDCNNNNNENKYRIQMHETVSDGRFTLNLGPGKYYLIARPYTFDNTSPIKLKKEWWAPINSTTVCSDGQPITIENINDDHTGVYFQLDLESKKRFAWNLFLPAILHK